MQPILRYFNILWGAVGLTGYSLPCQLAVASRYLAGWLLVIWCIVVAGGVACLQHYALSACCTLVGQKYSRSTHVLIASMILMPNEVTFNWSILSTKMLTLSVLLYFPPIFDSQCLFCLLFCCRLCILIVLGLVVDF